MSCSIAIRTRDTFFYLAASGFGLSANPGSTAPYLAILASISFLTSPLLYTTTSRSWLVSSKERLLFGLKASPTSPTFPVYRFLITYSRLKLGTLSLSFCSMITLSDSWVIFELPKMLPAFSCVSSSTYYR